MTHGFSKRLWVGYLTGLVLGICFAAIVYGRLLPGLSDQERFFSMWVMLFPVMLIFRLSEVEVEMRRYRPVWGQVAHVVDVDPPPPSVNTLVGTYQGRGVTATVRAESDDGRGFRIPPAYMVTMEGAAVAATGMSWALRRRCDSSGPWSLHCNSEDFWHRLIEGGALSTVTGWAERPEWRFEAELSPPMIKMKVCNRGSVIKYFVYVDGGRVPTLAAGQLNAQLELLNELLGIHEGACRSSAS